MFKSRRKLYLMLALVTAFSTLLGACAGAAAPAAARRAPAAPAAAPAGAGPAAPAVEPAATTPPAASDADKYGGVAIETYQQDAQSFDPPAAWATLDWIAVNRLLYNALYRYDEKSQIVPDLADGQPEVSADGLVWTIKLKSGVKFSNGREFVADDVKYSLERNAGPDSGTWDATDPMANVVGGQEIIDGKATTADGIKVVDPHTVQFTLLHPDAYFLATLTLTTNLIVPKEEVEEWGKDFGFHPVGTGPFMLKDWTPKQSITFVRNPDYFVQGQPYLDGVEFQIGADPAVSLLRFQKGETDVLGDGVPVAQIPTIVADPVLGPLYKRTPSLMMYFVAFNMKTAPFDNVKVRQAIAMALNKDNYVKLTSDLGTRADDWLPSSDFVCNTTADQPMYPYDPAAAKKLLADAGYPDGLNVEVWFRGDKASITRLPEAMQQDLAAIGVKVELLQLDKAVAQQQEKDGKLGLYADDWGASFPDPHDFGTQVFLSASSTATNARYANPEVDRLVTAATQELDPAKRCQDWQQAAALFMQDLPMIPVVMLGSPSITPPHLQGWDFIPANPGPPWATVWMPKADRR